jgi:hypothetical protein
MASDQYVTIREILGDLIGRTVVDVTQHDAAEFQAGESAYVMLMFDDGNYVKFPVGDEGFDHNCDSIFVE